MRTALGILFPVLVAASLACGSGGEPGEIVRTPDERFADLAGWSFEPRYEEIDGLRIHYVDEGLADARPVLLLHGEPSWAYLYRKMIPVLTEAGFRAIVPDLVGFGRSDKYVRREDYSCAMQVGVMAELVRRLDLQGTIFFGQDWGGLVGLRVVAEDPGRFAAVVIGNAGLPVPAEGAAVPRPFRIWQLFSRYSPVFPIGRILDQGTTTELAPEIVAAYDAPFPSSRYTAGARAMPSLVPTSPEDPAVPANRAAWAVFEAWGKPFVLAFSDGDPITRGGDLPFRERVPGAQGQPHTTIEGAGHFLQEDRGEEVAALIVAVARGLGAPPSAGAARGARIFHGGAILTMDPARPSAEAVVVTEGRIRHVGSLEQARAVAPAEAEWVDLGTRALLPGFVDAHSHLMQTALKLATVPMDPPPAGDVTSIADIQARLRAELERAPRGADEWLIGWGYDNGMLADGRHPTKADLDAVSREVPIFLLHFSIHQSVLNSRALELAGIRADSEAPEGGVIQRLPGSREPNGILEETAHVPVLMRVAAGILDDGSGGETPRRLVDEALKLYARNGYTTVTEMGADPTVLAQLRQLADAGLLPLDVVAFLFYLTTPAEEVAAAYSTTYANRLRVGGGKINLDGGSPGRTAFLREPYHRQLPGEDGYRGYSSIEDQDRLNELVASYYEQDVPLAIHALGDAALDQCITAVRAAEQRFPGSDRRTQLIHLQQVQEDQFDALAELDVTLTFQVAHNYYFGDFHREVIYGPDRTERLNPARSALDRGLSVTLHHDSPVHPVDPFMLLWTAVERTTRSGRLIGPDQRIGVQQALEASTIEGARQLFEEDQKGSIEVGKLADLVILDRSPLAVPTGEIKDLVVLETIKEGATIYSRGAARDHPGARQPWSAHHRSGRRSQHEAFAGSPVPEPRGAAAAARRDCDQRAARAVACPARAQMGTQLRLGAASCAFLAIGWSFFGAFRSSLLLIREARSSATALLESSAHGRDRDSASRSPSRTSAQNRARASATRRSVEPFRDDAQRRASSRCKAFHMVGSAPRGGWRHPLPLASRPPRRAGSRCRGRGFHRRRRSCATPWRRPPRESARSCRRSACSCFRRSPRDRAPRCPGEAVPGDALPTALSRARRNCRAGSACRPTRAGVV
jgi:hypothetical protein